MYQRVLTYQQPSANIAHSIKVIPKNSAFFDEDFIEGIVEFNCTAQVIINDINLSLNSSENWSAYSKELNLNTNEKKSEVIFSINMDVKRQLNIPTNLIALKPGKFNFPFKFKLPRLVEPSFEFPGVEGKAFIRYILTANIISPYIRGMNQVYILMKRKQKIEINKTISFSKENSIHKWGLFDGGNTKLEITSVNGTDNFKYGENIKFNININNTKGKLNTTECKVVINRLVLFKSKYGETLKSYNDEIFAEKTKVETTPGEEKQFSYILNLKKIQNKNFNIKDYNMPYSQIDDINYFLPTVNASLIECSYSIKFSLYFNKFVKYDDRPRITMKGIICHQSMDEYKAEMDKQLQNNPPPPPPPMMNNNNFNPNMRNMTFNDMNMNGPPQQPPNAPHMPYNNGSQPPYPMNNNMNNINNNQEEDLPSMEEIEENKLMNQNQNNDYNNMNNNYGDYNNNNNNGNQINNYGDYNNNNENNNINNQNISNNFNNNKNNNYPEYPDDF